MSTCVTAFVRLTPSGDAGVALHDEDLRQLARPQSRCAATPSSAARPANRQTQRCAGGSAITAFGRHFKRPRRLEKGGVEIRRMASAPGVLAEGPARDGVEALEDSRNPAHAEDRPAARPLTKSAFDQRPLTRTTRFGHFRGQQKRSARPWPPETSASVARHELRSGADRA
jgi:hypothetical protein